MSKKIAVLGAGESGVGAAVLAKSKGLEVFVSDAGQIKKHYKEVLCHHEIKWEQGKHSSAEILEADELIISPGIPLEVPIVKAARELEKPVISEIEFASRFTEAKMIGITGTNGKTTTTLLTHHLLEKAGLNVGLAGNVGSSLAGQVVKNERDYYVVELSSFQLDSMFAFKAHIAILLNITPDHLERYNYEMGNYVNSKFRIIQNQGPDDHFIFNADDVLIQEAVDKKSMSSQLLPFSLQHEVDKGAYVKNEELIIHVSEKLKQMRMSIFDLALPGRHNLYNSMAAGIAARVLELRKEIIRESLADFQNIEHRLEFVASVHGIAFINDSKATNVNSTWYALESMDKPVIWIVGGVDKGNDYSQLFDLVKERVREIICLGKDVQKIHDAFADKVESITNAGSAQEAVAIAYQQAKTGEVVLLSPACASFDLFENYEDRGQQFKKAVRSL